MTNFILFYELAEINSIDYMNVRVGLDCAFTFDVCVLFFFLACVCESAATVHVLFNEQ